MVLCADDNRYVCWLGDGLECVMDGNFVFTVDSGVFKCVCVVFGVDNTDSV